MLKAISNIKSCEQRLSGELGQKTESPLVERFKFAAYWMKPASFFEASINTR